MYHARVTLLPMQTLLTVERHETILDAALRSGLNLPHSCKGGHCASCRARIVEGHVDYPSGLPLGLTPQEQAQGYALLCQAHALSAELAIEVNQMRSPIEVQVKSLPCRIERLQRLTADVMAVFLRLPAVEEFAYLPGQYIDVLLAPNRRRSFSIANAPQASGLLELHIRRIEGGEFTEQVFAQMQARSLLRIEGPLGQFCLRAESTRPALMIGGGTGYAPLRAMLEEVFERGEQRAMHLYWGARAQEDLYEHQHLLARQERYTNFRYTPVLSAPAAHDPWRGRTGPVHAAVLQDHATLGRFDVYAAGPPALIEAIRHEFVERGLPKEQLFFDSFDFAPDTVAQMRGMEHRPP